MRWGAYSEGPILHGGDCRCGNQERASLGPSRAAGESADGAAAIIERQRARPCARREPAAGERTSG